MVLFELPQCRSNREADNLIVKKTTNKKSASFTVKGGANNLLTLISIINATVESKLGKYKDDYLYYMADDENKFKDYIQHIIQNGAYAIDTETTGLDPMTDTIVGMSLYTPGEKALYIPIHHKSYISGIEVEGQLETKFLEEQLRLLVNCKSRMYNGNFDKRIIHKNIGVDLPVWFDAHLAAMCLNENEPHGLKNLHSKYVLEGKEDEWSFGKLFEGVTFDMVPIKTGYIYAARDAIDTWELVDFQLPYLTPGTPECTEQGLEKVSDVFWNIEMPFLEVITEMEDNGVALDPEYAQELSVKYHKKLDENLNAFYTILGDYKDQIEKYKIQHPNHKLSDPISVSSPTQLAILFYDILKIEPPDKEHPRGTGEEILEKIDNPLCKAILDYRGTDKLLGTYIDKMPDLMINGRVHCTFNQYGAKTGRLSSENPNMQNIPSHNKDIRKMFVASPGCVLLSGDFSQQEPRVMTAMCQDPEMIKAYKNGLDLYASIASIAFNKPYEDCLEFYPDGRDNPEGEVRRSSAKSILLGILYGRGINSIAEQLNTTKQKAKIIQDKVFKEFPAIKKFEEDSIEMAQTRGYVTTFWGRKRRLPDMQLPEFEFKYKEGYGDVDPLSFDTEIVELEVPTNVKRLYESKMRGVYKREDKQKVKDAAEKEGIIIKDNGGKIADATRQVVNSRIQGSAADMSKIAGINLFSNARLKELGFKLLVPIHDEYLAECPIEHAKECAKLMTECMCASAEAIQLPIKVDIAVSYKWKGEKLNLEEL
jgi:DNA polymerase I-like protein with 3'-5' exonuclease and polymerase domains